jgi:hypothetical protein
VLVLACMKSCFERREGEKEGRRERKGGRKEKETI